MKKKLKPFLKAKHSRYLELVKENKLLHEIVQNLSKTGSDSLLKNRDFSKITSYFPPYIIYNSDFIFNIYFYKRFISCMAILVQNSHSAGFVWPFNSSKKVNLAEMLNDFKGDTLEARLKRIAFLKIPNRAKGALIGEFAKTLGNNDAEDRAILALAAWFYDPLPFRLKYLIFRLYDAGIIGMAYLFLDMLPKDLSLSQSEQRAIEQIIHKAKGKDSGETEFDEFSIFLNARQNAQRLSEVLEENENLRQENYSLSERLHAYAILEKYMRSQSAD